MSHISHELDQYWVFFFFFFFFFFLFSCIFVLVFIFRRVVFFPFGIYVILAGR